MTGRAPVLCMVVLFAAACSKGGAPPRDVDAEASSESPGLSMLSALAGADTVGYARAFEPRLFSFPEDHGPHPEYRTEWWYVTGNLDGDGGGRYGFQLTIFRSALVPTPPRMASAWATGQAFMGHFAVTDVGRGTFQSYERFERGAMGLAGAEAAPLRVWIDQWDITGYDSTSAFPMRLRAVAPGAVLDLTLAEGKPPVLQGDRGLSQKGPEPGNASYYYSQTRLPAEGTLVIAGDSVAVDGSAWLDREWSTSALSEGQVGWDWFALQLDDGWDLMVYQLRRADGTADPLSDGVLVDPDGRRVPLVWGSDIQVASTGTWSSPVDGAPYPSGWTIEIPARGWNLVVRPAIENQELDLAFRYWEGAVDVAGTGEGGRPATGRGYVELTGYAGAPPRN